VQYNVQDFGAKGDNQTLDHPAIQAALDRCSAEGGGVVTMPPGIYLCGTLHLRSNVCLWLEHGAMLKSCEQAEFYPEICKTPYGNLPGQIQALLWAEEVENVTVAGFGIIDGGCPDALSSSEAAQLKFRPALLFFRNCRRLKLVNVTLQNANFWTLHLLRCQDVQIRGISIFNNPKRINSDGIDPDGCRNVIISDCQIVAGDDCIVVKSTEGDPCENIAVTNCLLSTTQSALKLGTESLGRIANLVFSNCVIYQTNMAIALFMKDGGTYENVLFSNITAETYGDYPLIVDVTPRYYQEPKIGIVRNITFQNLIFSGRGRAYFEGTPDKPLENITLQNLTWNVTGDFNWQQTEKPNGAKRIVKDPYRRNYAQERARFIAVHINGFRQANISVTPAPTVQNSDRFFFENVQETR
jgi:polygalacturonase